MTLGGGLGGGGLLGGGLGSHFDWVSESSESESVRV